MNNDKQTTNGNFFLDAFKTEMKESLNVTTKLSAMLKAGHSSDVQSKLINDALDKLQMLIAGVSIDDFKKESINNIAFERVCLDKALIVLDFSNSNEKPESFILNDDDRWGIEKDIEQGVEESTLNSIDTISWSLLN